MRFFITMLTAADNESADVGRVLMAFLGVSFVLLVAYDMVWRGHALDYMGFGTVAAGILGGGGVGLGFKHRSEPGAYGDGYPPPGMSGPGGPYPPPRPPSPAVGPALPDALPEPDPNRIPRGAR